MRHERQQRRGANAIEFALTLPLYLLIVLGIMDFGYLYHIQAGLDNAAATSCREGAKIDPNDGDPVATASAFLTSRSALFCSGGCTMDVQDLNTGQWEPPDRTIKCGITRSYTPLIGLVPHPATLSSVSFQRLEWQRNPTP
ncbi:MAG: pilus assembly protein [Alphaproteobacteria bacterium]|nr:pilus assembly protein [Alphaproteobacteria bacterium]